MSLPNQNIQPQGGVCYIISAEDLRNVIKELYHEERQRTAQAIADSREVPTICRPQAARLLNVALSTLWRWDRDGYLKPVKIGSKVLYRKTDIDRLLIKAGKGGAK